MLEIAGQIIKKGERVKIEIPMSELFDTTEVPLSIEVIRGEGDGPTLFVSAAIHGDEIIGTEIVKRLLAKEELGSINGALICIPIVNRFGYNNSTRYLPDRRDLNRCFPGSSKGSLAARIAHIFLNEVVAKCDYGIDIHSAAIHRANYPQIRSECKDDTEINLAMAFGAPIIVQSPNRDGALRNAANKIGVKTILFEVGEALRFDEHGIHVGVNGILNVMRELEMLPKNKSHVIQLTSTIAQSSHWIRAQASGSLRIFKKLGSIVHSNELLGVISDAFGSKNTAVYSRDAGIIVGEITMPLVNKGDALFHIATSEDIKDDELNKHEEIVLDKDIDIENEDWFMRT